MWSVKPGNPFCSQIDYSAVSAVDLSFEDEGLVLWWSSVVEWTLSSLTEMLPHQPSLPFLVHQKAHFYSLMHSHLLTISASFNLITFTYKYKYKYFCFPSLACFLLPPPPRFPAESVTMLCMPSSHGWQWDWWSFQVSTLCPSGADSSLFILNFPLHGLSDSILHTSAVVGHIVCLLQLMTNMNPGSNCPSLNIFQVFFFLLKLKRCWWGPDPSLKDSKFPHM